MLQGFLTPGAHETLTPGDTATGITAAIIQPTASDMFKNIHAQGALITVESNTINFCIDGTTPTAAAGTNAGHQMDAGQSYMIESPYGVAKFKCIDRISGSASKVKVTTFF